MNRFQAPVPQFVRKGMRRCILTWQHHNPGHHHRRRVIRRSLESLRTRFDGLVVVFGRLSCFCNNSGYKSAHRSSSGCGTLRSSRMSRMYGGHRLPMPNVPRKRRRSASHSVKTSCRSLECGSSITSPNGTIFPCVAGRIQGSECVYMINSRLSRNSSLEMHRLG